ncbi:MAG: hypothetical protein H6557_06995 [Lewinellaceae bacterium]|nr:hypothetical protein [Phaeodactylibacter sp.]MCB9036349.1 hypothetical protein [Lewinellaceae bacterium]
MSDQNTGPNPQAQGSPNSEKKESSAGLFIRKNLGWLIPLGLLLLFFIVPPTRHWFANKVRCSLVSAKDGTARVEACRQYLGKASFAKASCNGDCSELVDYADARQSRSYELLRSYVDKYEASAPTAHFREIFNLLDSVTCAVISVQPDRKAANCRAYKDEFGQAGKCYDDCHAYLDAYDCEAARQATNRREAYQSYVDKYGFEGRCYEEFQLALEKGVPATMEQPAGRINAPANQPKSQTASGKTPAKKATPSSSRTCQTFTVGSRKFKAIQLGPLWWTAENMNQGGFINWQQARMACPSGWRLPCTREVEHLIREFYSNPDKAYTYLTSQDPRNCEFNLEFTGFQWTPGMATSELGTAAGFWCMDDLGPASTMAGSYLFRKNGRAIEILPNTEKGMGLNCRCVKESKDYKKSSLRFTPCVGMP